MLARLEGIEANKEWRILLRAKAREAREDFIQVEWRTEGLENFLRLNFWVDRGSYDCR